MIKNLIIIFIILGLVVVGQQPFFHNFYQNIYSWIKNVIYSDVPAIKTTNLKGNIYNNIFKEDSNKTEDINQNKPESQVSEFIDSIKNKKYPNISEEITKKTEEINQEINSQIEEQKEKISQTLTEKLKNYFSNIVDSIFFPNKIIQKTPESLENSMPQSEVLECIETCKNNE